MSAPWESAVRQYLTALRGAVATGDATEATHRPALKTLVESLVKAVNCVNEPKGSSAGRPDFKVLLGETPLGFIETKDIGANLIETQDSPQLKRYLASSGNLILTDYLDFRWFKKGLLTDTVRLAQLTPKGTIAAVPGADAQLHDLLLNFLKADLITIASPKELAQRMAGLAKTVRKKIIEAFEGEAEVGELHTQLKAFREVLLPDLDVPKFADMYAQTICYGLFAAKCEPSTPPLLARDNAASYLPKTNPFLRKLFASIMAGDLNERVAFAIDGITFLLNHADVPAILQDFGKRTRKEDPVVHFYETFLAEYDSKLRKSRGVYYTPEPVVSYIVRSVDWLLKEKFNKPDGLADPSVLVLDPACGTGTFLYTVINLIHERINKTGQYGAWNNYVKEKLLPRIFGFELLMAPYAVAHLKLGLLLQQTGYDFSGDERLGIFLTNTLEEAAKKSDILFAQWISDESNAAAGIKRDKPIMVVLGNPPYAGHSANKGAWIANLVEDYKRDCPELYKPAQAKWLQDDYVKFIRWGQWRIERSGRGILALITNNGYIDHRSFRGMRQQLCRAFGDVSVLDLHGSLKKKEKCPDGSKDENVFDIQSGVAIGVFVRPPRMAQGAVQWAELWGPRTTPENSGKYDFLSAHDCTTTDWETASPQAPLYLLSTQRLQDTPTRCEFYEGVLPHEIMPGCLGPNGKPPSGLATMHDAFAIAMTAEELVDNVEKFLRTETREEAENVFGALCNPAQWSYEDAKSTLRGSDWRSSIVRLWFAPFDRRWTAYERHISVHLRRRLSDHLVRRENLALVVGGAGQEVSAGDWNAVSCVNAPLQLNFFRRNGSPSIPLYLYPSASPKEGLFDDSGDAPAGRKPNLAPEFTAEMEKRLGLKFDPDLECGSLRPLSDRELAPGRQSASKLAHSKTFGPRDVFNYIYAIFHSPTYRKRYAEFLKIDFPRVPLTSDKGLFRKLCALGGELVGLHLMESPVMDKLVTTYPKQGNDVVEKVEYLEIPPPSTKSAAKDKGRVFINRDQYFAGIRPEEWEFHIGGYQVLQKWLKDRKGRKLTADDLTHYQRIVVALRETIRLMAEIDRAIPKWPIE